MSKETLKLDFLLETVSCSEIIADNWLGDDIESIDESVLSEMVKDDEKPFFVEFVGLYEGMSGNRRLYTKEAVESCVDAMIGVNMYKGHQQPGSESWLYREPVGKIVAARIATIEVGGKRVLAAKGKAYITEADTKLRSDIKKKMAGPLSILGDARAVRQLGSDERRITHIHKPLKSIDFCNPGTNGMELAGVTAVVTEMSNDGKTQGKEEDGDMAKLTKEQLLAEYGTFITEIIGEQMDVQVKAVASDKRELSEAKQAFETQKAEHDAAIAEMKKEITDLKAERDVIKGKLDKQDEALKLATVKDFAAEAVAEMKKSDDHDEKVVEMASEGIEPLLVDGDIEKSKSDFKNRLDKAVARTEKIFEMAGGKQEDTTPTRKLTKNESRADKKKGPTINDFISPDLVKAGDSKD